MDKKENKKEKSNPTAKTPVKAAVSSPAGTGRAERSVYAERKKRERSRDRRGPGGGRGEGQDEYEQRIVDIARVTRVMAGGKRMRFRACVVLGNKKGKVAVGIAKGADVTMAVTKAVNKAKKEMIDVAIVNDTIPHEIYQKKGAAKVLLKPARRGKGVIAGGAVRIILELAGVKNITSKILGSNNKINIANCTVAALANLKKVESKKEGKGAAAKPDDKKTDAAKEDKA
ncbi:MAG: 30S ribosomal protein S5 [Planctomycetes bacterium]|jgi:small subunit ribosomal protein S5|nr:30S ribosomal protein S5 [Planctomycetota bacterium]